MESILISSFEWDFRPEQAGIYGRTQNRMIGWTLIVSAIL